MGNSARLGHFSMSRNQAKAVGLLHWLKLVNTRKRKNALDRESDPDGGHNYSRPASRKLKYPRQLKMM